MKSMLLSLTLLFTAAQIPAQEPAPVLQLREDIRVLAIISVGNHILAVLSTPLPSGGRSIELVDLSNGQTVLVLLEGVKAVRVPTEVKK